MNNFSTFEMKTAIHFGDNALDRLKEIPYKRVLIITDPFVDVYKRQVVQGCGPIGLICIAVLRTMGIENICAVDGNEKRLEFAKRMGATRCV